FFDRGAQQRIAGEATLIAPDSGYITKTAADESRQTFYEEIDPAFNVTCRIFIVKVSIANKYVVFRGHALFSGKPVEMKLTEGVSREMIHETAQIKEIKATRNVL